MVHSSALRSGMGGRTRNVRTALLLVGAALGLFTLAVVYISLFQ